MKRWHLAVTAALLSLSSAASAHRLDEYLQATILSVDKSHLEASMRLIPGVAVASAVIASIDTNGDGVFSPDEQRAYAQRVLNDLTLTLDGTPLQPKLASITIPTPDHLRDGLGEIHLDFTAALPSGYRSRRLTLENRHQPHDSVYLVNALVPTDPDIQIIAQHRNDQQSLYELDYTQSNVPPAPLPVQWSTSLRETLAASGFANLFHLGMRHIAEGTDHLLFLLALLLPAPLLAVGHRWGPFAGLRTSLRHILTIVTAFTLGHSITLALAAWGIVSVPSHPIEILIAVSILVSAIHALRPLFAGKEAVIAAFFGLIHGLAFASTLTTLGLGHWERVFGILAFNLGIETMQLLVVALTMPSLVLISRTAAYPFVRITGALFAAIAATGWIYERLLNRDSLVDTFVNALAHHALWIAAALFLVGLSCLPMRPMQNRQTPEPRSLP